MSIYENKEILLSTYNRSLAELQELRNFISFTQEKNGIIEIDNMIEKLEELKSIILSNI
jgi:hypothetical protein